MGFFFLLSSSGNLQRADTFVLVVTSGTFGETDTFKLSTRGNSSTNYVFSFILKESKKYNTCKTYLHFKILPLLTMLYSTYNTMLILFNYNVGKLHYLQFNT